MMTDDQTTDAEALRHLIRIYWPDSGGQTAVVRDRALQAALASKIEQHYSDVSDRGQVGGDAVMSAEPKRVELTEAERESLFRAGDHHPDHCDCSAFADEVGYAPDSEEVCEALVNSFVVVERIIASREAAARREALLEVRRSVAVIRTPLNNLVGLSRAQAFHVGVGEVATLLDNTLLAEPERDKEGGR